MFDFCLGYRNVSHHYHQQSSSGLHSHTHTPLPHVTFGLKPFAEIIYVIFNINNLKIFTLKKVKLLSFNYLIGIM